MSSSIIPLNAYLRNPGLCAEHITAIRKQASENFPEIIRIAEEQGEPGIAYMDGYYAAWIKKEKHGKRIKKRHISRVTKGILKNMHDCINNWFYLPSHNCVYSYKEGLSTAHCAQDHVGSFALYKLDITDFFPSITRTMIRNAYQDYFDRIWNKQKKQLVKHMIHKADMDTAARLFAILCTRSDTRKRITDDAVLPIGIVPASSISNHILLPVDEELTTLAARHKLRYTRYSDNLFFSTSTDTHIERDIQEQIKIIIEGYSCDGKRPFRINAQKTQYSPRWTHQRVLGIVVNEKLNISKGKEKWLRSALNHLYYDTVQLHTVIVTRGVDRVTAHKAFAGMYRKAQRIFGQLSYIQAVAPCKYKKYSAQQHAIKLLLEESKLDLQLFAEEEGARVQNGGIA